MITNRLFDNKVKRFEILTLYDEYVVAMMVLSRIIDSWSDILKEITMTAN